MEYQGYLATDMGYIGIIHEVLRDLAYPGDIAVFSSGVSIKPDSVLQIAYLTEDGNISFDYA